jgi:hypothetical protein
VPFFIAKNKKMKGIFTMKKHLKRIFAAVMAAVTLITAMPSVSALFVTTEWFSYTYEFNGRLGKGFWGQIPKFTTADGKIAYCIQENTNTFSAEHSVSEFYDGLAPMQQNNIRLSLIYGYKGNPQYGFSDDVERLATQIMIWLIVYGWYDTGDETAALNIYTENMPSNVASNVKTVYGRMKEGMSEHYNVPSFTVRNQNLISQATYELERDSNGNFTKTLTDEYNVLSQFSWTYSGATVTTSGNNMTITSSTPVVSLQLNGAKTRSRYNH